MAEGNNAAEVKARLRLRLSRMESPQDASVWISRLLSAQPRRMKTFGKRCPTTSRQGSQRSSRFMT
jgi:hypothetical protein